MIFAAVTRLPAATSALLQSDVGALNISALQIESAHAASIGLSSTSAGSAWSVSADANWISFATTSGVTPATVRASIDVTHLSVGVANATITVTATDGTLTIPVTVTVDPLALTVLRSDSQSSKVYGISEAAPVSTTSRAYLLAIDTLTERVIGVVRVGSSATDLTVHHGDNRVYVPNWQNGGILVINPSTLEIERTIPTAPYGPSTYDGGDSIYIASGPPGRVIAESALSFTNVTLFDSTSGAKLAITKQVFGGGECSTEGKFYYHGDSGSSAAKLHKFDVTADKFSEVAAVAVSGLNTFGSRPVVVADDGTRVFWNGTAFRANLTVEWVVGDNVLCASSDGRYAFSRAKIYDVDAQRAIGDMPIATTVSAFNSATARLVVQNGTQVAFYEPVGAKLLGAAVMPMDGTIVALPTQLSWAQVSGADNYRVYFGTSATAVAAATTNSPEYLGTVSTSSIALPGTATLGQFYVWRVDVLVGGIVVGTQSQHFTASAVQSDASSIAATTVQGFSGYSATVHLSSASAGLAWSASPSDNWVKCDATTGTTPSTLKVMLDASQLSSGVHTSAIKVTGSWGTFILPVSLTVDPLALTVLKSDPQSADVYGISEASSTTDATRAYLLEIDSLGRTITRVVRVGSSATDLAVHHGDNRVYVPNWALGALLAVNLDTFSVEQSYATAPYSDSTRDDIRYVTAAARGRLIGSSGSPQNDNHVRLFDTAAGAVLADPDNLDAPGQCDASGRFCYAGGKFSGWLTKYDMAANTFNQVASTKSVGNVGYPPLTPVVTASGNRIFWRGCVYDSALRIIGVLADAVTCVDETGAHAFSTTAIYDVDHQRAIGPMPVSTAVAAFNNSTRRLVLQNGTTLGFYEPFGPGVLGAITPADGAIVSSASRLSWTAVPGADGYQVYFGSSLDAVNAATSSSAEYVGTITGASSVALPAAAASGRTNYWRVDVIVGGLVVGSQTQRFSLAPVVPDILDVDTRTVQGCVNTPVAVQLNGTGAGQAWTATVQDSWVELGATAGITPATLPMNLDASALAVGTHTTSVTVSGPWGSWSLPVTLQVDPLAVTVARSDPRTAKVYAISEASATTGLTRAYLLEIDAYAEQISRVVAVGSGATSLAVHPGDNHAYVPNWLLGGTLGVNLTTFAVDRAIPTPAYERDQFNGADAFRVAAGAPGRLITEGMDQTIQFCIYDTATGQLLTAFRKWMGGGQCDPSGKYYYHGDKGVSSSTLQKFDVSADTFSLVGMPQSSVITEGTSAPVVAEDGSRIYWAGAAYRPDLSVEAALPGGTVIYATTKDGRCAISDTGIYDITNPRSVAYSLPGAGKTAAYNSHTQQVVLQVGTQIGFYHLDPTVPLPTPVLTVTAQGATDVQFTWTADSLPTGFTIQYRFGSTSAWTSLPDDPIDSTRRSYRIQLGAPLYLQYRIRADSAVNPSAWSDPVIPTALPAVPTFIQSPASQIVNAGGSVTLSSNVSSSGVATIQWYKDGAPLPGVTENTLTLTDVSQRDVGVYLVKATNAGGTTTSAAATLTVLSPQIVNFSIRSNSGPGDQVLIVGYGVNGQKSVLLRGVGPGLIQYGVSGVLANPQLDLYRGDIWLAGNDDWSMAENAAEVAGAATRLGAFPLVDGAKDAAMLADLDSGAYSVKVSGADGGVALAEIYDADPSAGVRLINASARSFVGTGDRVLIGGFVVVGPGVRTILVRAIGPTLANFNVSGVLTDPEVDVVTTTGIPISNNDNWGGTQTLASVFDRVGAFGLDSSSRDAAILVKLPAGNYSAIVRGVGDSTGIALLEIYDVQ